MKTYHKLIILTLLATTGAVGLGISHKQSELTPKIDVNLPQITYQQRVGQAEIYPDIVKTPGMKNLDISQSNIDQTICNSNWSTKSIRPSVQYTNSLKSQELNSGYNYKGDTNPKNYELDHLIPLELGGNPTSEQNLWPEPYNTAINKQTIGAHEKDRVENSLHKEVCNSDITLQKAQEIITSDWYACYLTIKNKQICK